MWPLVYGPHPSWRLGWSLGVDIVSSGTKICTFNCPYCELGDEIEPSTVRQEMISLSRLQSNLELARGVYADYVTFSGTGEPTLASNLAQAIDLVKEILGLPVAVLTNSSLLTRPDVRKDLAGADIVIAKLDAPDDALLQAVNRPAAPCTVSDILDGISALRRDHPGRVALQMMFVEANRDAAAQLAQIAREIKPDEVQLCTPIRPSLAEPLSIETMREIRREFTGLRVRCVFDGVR
jgi:wyosine [tRNA(Phe)-imidazoG37] synthetase (radical SAM superfamily)